MTGTKKMLVSEKWYSPPLEKIELFNNKNYYIRKSSLLNTNNKNNYNNSNNNYNNKLITQQFVITNKYYITNKINMSKTK